MKRISIKRLIVNLYNLSIYDFSGQSWKTWSSIKQLQIANSMLHYYISGDAKDYQEEYEFLFSSENNDLVRFPYPQIKQIDNIVVSFDRQIRMPYINHKSKELYFPSSFSVEKCAQTYRFLIEQDQILGGGYLKKSPHCYETDRFYVGNKVVLVDCGGAEGLFTLEHVDKIKKGYIIECDRKWIPALRATFAPYPNVEIINKTLSGIDDIKDVSLESILRRHEDSECFVKMDIEGGEKSIITCSKDYLANRKNIKIVCCTYHYEEDASILARLFDEIGYEYEFSEGYFFFALYDMPRPPYLRRALIRAWNN